MRLTAGTATSIAIGLDHTPSSVAAVHYPRTGGVRFAAVGGAVIFSGRMAVSVEIHHTGCDPDVRAEIIALVEHVLSDRSGDWRVSIIGSHANDRWEMKILGPNHFERSYTLEGADGQHDPRVIAALVSRMVPGRP